MKPHLGSLLTSLGGAALIGATACVVSGWAVTAHELNTLVAYRPVGWEALRERHAKEDAAARVRLARHRVRDRADRADAFPGRRVMRAVYETSRSAGSAGASRYDPGHEPE